MNNIHEALVVDILRKEYHSWIEGLSDIEKYAIRKYTYNSRDTKPNRFFERLNAFLRGDYNKSDSDILSKYGVIISEALKKHQLQHNIICYRGVDVDVTVGLNSKTVFTFDQFISTSVVRSRAISGKYLYIISVPSGTTGAYIEEISKYPRQREFLLDKSCKYSVVSKHESIKYLEVVL